VTITECLDGPIFLEWENSWADALVAGMADLAREMDSTVLVLQDCPRPDVQQSVVAALRQCGNRATLRPAIADAVLPLRGENVEQLWKAFNHGTRQRIKKARANGLEIRPLEAAAELSRAREVWTATATRKGFSNVRPWPSLEPVIAHCIGQGLGSVLGSFRDGKLLAAAFITYIGDTASYVYGGYADGARQYSPSHVLQYEAIRESVSRGLGWYNFGSLLGSSQPEARGVDDFKLGFGAIPRPHLETVVWERKPLLYASMEWLRRGWLGRNLESQLRKALIRREKGVEVLR
jgi:lipid II:glycine glycyltransferase (peptidoglycan interpeptide bridge formation enzyme)